MMENMSLSRRIYMAVGFLVLASVSFLVFLTWDSWSGLLASRFNQSEPVVLPTPTGTMIITAVKLDGEGADMLPQNYAWDLSNPDPTWQRIGDLSQGLIYSAFLEPTNVYNPVAVFVRLMVIGADRVLTESLAHADLVSGQASLLDIDMGDNPKQLAWSESAGLLAYQGEESVGSSSQSIIRLYNPETRSITLTLTDAWQPLWSSDGVRLVYLRDSGVYYLDLSNGVETLLMGVKDYNSETRHLDGNTKIGLSPNDRYLAWTSPSNRALYIFDIKSWSPANLEMAYTLSDPDTHFYWPTFSPDSKLVSVQSINVDSQTGQRFNPELRVYALGRDGALATMSLSDFDFDRLFTDTWLNVSLHDLDHQGYFGQTWSLILPGMY